MIMHISTNIDTNAYIDVDTDTWTCIYMDTNMIVDTSANYFTSFGNNLSWYQYLYFQTSKNKTKQMDKI